ncbi:MAG: MmcQ/YjbR family DNA-binding protein [Bacillota bacterium]
MTEKILMDLCLSYPGAWLDYPFGPVPTVVKVGRKMFAIISQESEAISIALKCEPDMAALLRNEYPSVKPGYHLNKQHWNTVFMDGTIPSGLWELMIAMSYNLVVKTMTKTEKQALPDWRNR